MKAYKKLMDWLSVVEKLVLSVVLVFITAITFINVVIRKLTDGQFAWTEELVINLFVLIIMLGCALSVREGGLISLSLIYDRVGFKAKKVFVAIITVANLIFWALLLKTGMDKVLSQIESGKFTTSLNWPEWVFTIFLPIGALFLILHTIEYFLDVMTAREEKGGSERMINLILFGTFFVLLFLNIPICVSLGLSSVLALMYKGPKIASIVPTNVYSSMAKFLLLAIPFFVLSGNIMARAGISTRLVQFIDDCIGHRRGGIAIVCVVVACFFGAISGSGPATVAALGIILIPAMINRGGFSAPFSSAMMATASSIAIVIPPSISFVVYASLTSVNVGDMFMGGILPGIMMGVALVAVIMIEVRQKNLPASRNKASWGERWKSFRTAFWGFLMPVIILGGIYGGFFTPTEAAAVSVVYGLFVGVFIYREVKFRELYEILVDSAKTTGGIMLIIGAASLFSYVCTVYGISKAAQTLLLSVAGNKYIFLVIVNVIFLIAGCFVDANSAMYIFIPIMYPVAQQLGINLVHFGVISTVNLAIGQVTPPGGVNLFVAIGISDKLQGLKDKTRVTIESISKAVWPMVVACIVALLLITYVEFFSTAFLQGGPLFPAA